MSVTPSGNLSTMTDAVVDLFAGLTETQTYFDVPTEAVAKDRIIVIAEDQPNIGSLPRPYLSIQWPKQNIRVGRGGYCNGVFYVGFENEVTVAATSYTDAFYQHTNDVGAILAAAMVASEAGGESLINFQQGFELLEGPIRNLPSRKDEGKTDFMFSRWWFQVGIEVSESG